MRDVTYIRPLNSNSLNSSEDHYIYLVVVSDFQQCGIHLEETSRQKVVELNDRILQIGQHFAAGTHKSRTVKKSSLPRQIRHHFNTDGENVVLSGKYNFAIFRNFYVPCYEPEHQD